MLQCETKGIIIIITIIKLEIDYFSLGKIFSTAHSFSSSFLPHLVYYLLVTGNRFRRSIGRPPRTLCNTGPLAHAPELDSESISPAGSSDSPARSGGYAAAGSA